MGCTTAFCKVYVKIKVKLELGPGLSLEIILVTTIREVKEIVRKMSKLGQCHIHFMNQWLSLGQYILFVLPKISKKKNWFLLLINS